MTPFPREAIRSWLAKLTDLPTDLIIFEDEPDVIPGVDNAGNLNGLLTVTMTSVDPIFWETRSTDAPGTSGPSTPIGTPNAQFTTIEQAYVTLTLVYECFDAATTALASDTLAKVRVRAYQAPNLQSLWASCACGIVDVGKMNRVTTTINDRAISTATMDMKLSTPNVDIYLDDFIEGVDALGEGALAGVELDVDAGLRVDYALQIIPNSGPQSGG